MTIKEKFDAVGESYDDVRNRLVKEDRIERFANTYFTTGDYEKLEKSIETRDITNSFEYSHRLKGNSLNIGFSRLADVASLLCEYTRNNDVTDFVRLDELFENVRVEYGKLRKVFV